MMGSFSYDRLKSDYLSKGIFGFKRRKTLDRENRNVLVHVVEKLQVWLDPAVQIVLPGPNISPCLGFLLRMSLYCASIWG